MSARKQFWIDHRFGIPQLRSARRVAVRQCFAFVALVACSTSALAVTDCADMAILALPDVKITSAIIVAAAARPRVESIS